MTTTTTSPFYNFINTGYVRIDGILKPQYYKTHNDKKKALTRFKRTGVEDDVNAVCSDCLPIVRPAAKKDPTNKHYGCVYSCCAFLHRWNACDECIKDHVNPVVKSMPNREEEAKKFVAVFSRLPDDVQRYVRKYIPTAFDYARYSKLIRYDSDLVMTERLLNVYVNMPRSAWLKVYKIISDGYFGSGINKSSSRSEIRDKFMGICHHVCDDNEEYVVNNTDFMHPGRWSGLHKKTAIAKCLQDVRISLYNSQKTHKIKRSEKR